MRILGLETSGEIGSVGVIEDEKSFAEISFSATLRHGEKLLPAVQIALDLSELKKEEIDLIAIATGPGSFTGLRIGIATARGLGESLQIPVIGIASADVYEFEARSWNLPSWILFPDRQDWLYAVFNGKGEVNLPLASYTLDSFMQIANEHPKSLFIGPGVEKHRLLIKSIPEAIIASEKTNWPSGIGVARLGLEKFEKELQNRDQEIEPLYLQPPLASANKR
jgi:tRNA threonylcarbamoyladenosine biosynthesis protein TsaB